MIEFDVEQVSGGWLTTRTPDDVLLTVETDAESDTFSIGLSEVLELYGYVVHERPCDLVVGTGKFVEIEPSNDAIRFSVGGIDVETTFEMLQKGLEPSLQAIFQQKDQYGDVERRDDQLRHVRNTLEDEGVPVDVGTLYESLVRE